MKNFIKSVCANLGVLLQNPAIALAHHKTIGGMQYATVLPLATYSPWLDDREFIRAYGLIKKNTLVDQYRCFELWELLGQVSSLPGDILEVGVWRGGTGALLATRAKVIGMQKIIYLCDTFSGVVKVTEKDSSYFGGEHSDTTEKQVFKLIQSLDVGDVRILKGVFPDDFATEMEKCIFSFVHIDVDVNQSAKDVMNFVWPRLAIGGMVVFDDFGFDTCDGIATLVAEYRGLRDRVVLHNLNGHAILVKTRG